MNDHDALLRAICENPREDTPRLAFADWLEENGSPERAAFIRTDIAMSLRDEWDPERLKWEETLAPELVAKSPWVFPRWNADVVNNHPTWGGIPVHRRGFPWAVRLGWFEYQLSAILTTNPIQYIIHNSGPSPLRKLISSPWFRRLTGLEIEFGELSPALLGPLVSNNAAHLEELSFRQRGITPSGGTALLESRLVDNLIVLGFSDVGPQVGRAVLAGFPKTRLVRLRRLDLPNAFPSEGSQLFARNGVPTTVRILNIADNRLNAERMMRLVEAGTFGNLKILKAHANPLGNAGATALFTSPHLAGLKVLDLSYCMVGDEALRALLDNSLLADGLNLLNLTGSPASADMKQAVKDRMGDRVRL